MGSPAATRDTGFRVPADAVIRANPGYELVALERLPAAERARLATADRTGEVYGVLRPTRGSGLPPTLVSPETALLLLSVASPGQVPAYLAGQAGSADAGRELARLVLDRLLEIQVGGDFVTGPEARAGLRTGPPPPPAAQEDSAHPLRRLSVDALRHAEELAGADPLAVAARLYCYHREPLTPQWSRTLATERDRERFLRIAPDAPAGRVLDRHWQPVPEVSRADGWYAWRGRTWRQYSSGRPLRYKLYVSPVTEALPAVLPAFVQLATDAGVPSFKLGRSPVGLLRPDKLVAYFATYDELAATAARLPPAAAGWPAQGVPFTAPVDPAGVVSWGLDPPARGSGRPAGVLDLPSAGRQSWRMWVAFRLAGALVSASRAAPADTPGWRFALDRLRADGIDTDSWTPFRDPWEE